MRVAGSTGSSSVSRFFCIAMAFCDSGGPQGQASVSWDTTEWTVFLVGICTSNSAAGTRDVQIRI